MILDIKNLRIQYAQKTIIDQFNLSLEKGQIYCLLGDSGSGKSSILRAIAGLIKIDAGEIYLEQEKISTKDYQKPTHQRKIGMMFQDFALFPHLNVLENIRLGLLNLNQKAQKQRIDEMLELVGLSALYKAMPHQLSGGQQQRLALARSLAPKPLCLLLDEPFSSLDPILREQLSLDVRDILKYEQMSALIVTHDHQEAFAIADQVAVLAEKNIQQIGTPENLYHLPKTPYIAQLMGRSSFIDGIVVQEAAFEKDKSALFLTPLGYIKAHKKQYVAGCERCVGEAVKILIRPDDIILEEITKEGKESSENISEKNKKFKVKVLGKTYRGADFLYQLELLEVHADWCCRQQNPQTSQEDLQKIIEPFHLLAQAPSRQEFAIGQVLNMHMDLHYLSAFI